MSTNSDMKMADESSLTLKVMSLEKSMENNSESNERTKNQCQTIRRQNSC